MRSRIWSGRAIAGVLLVGLWSVAQPGRAEAFAFSEDINKFGLQDNFQG
jgi:hypothetical protein